MRHYRAIRFQLGSIFAFDHLRAKGTAEQKALLEKLDQRVSPALVSIAEPMSTLGLTDSPWQGEPMNFYSGDKFSGPKTREERRCRCGAQPKLVHTMLDPLRGLIVRTFECQCGERGWTEDQE